MQIHVHTDSTIGGGTKLTSYLESEVAATLSRFSELLQRIEVHLSDESAGSPAAPRSAAWSRPGRRPGRPSP